jgi:hypothetical protein
MDEHYVVTPGHFQQLCTTASDEDLNVLLGVAHELLQCSYEPGLACLALAEEEMQRRGLPVQSPKEARSIRFPF